MSGTSLGRMKRIIHITNLIFEREARVVAELKAIEADIESQLSRNMEFLDGATGVGTELPELIVRNAAKLANRRKENAVELSRQIDRAVEARASNIGATNRLEKEVQRRESTRNAATLEELADRIARRRR